MVIARCLSGLKSPPESSLQLTASGALVLESESSVLCRQLAVSERMFQIKTTHKIVLLEVQSFYETS